MRLGEFRSLWLWLGVGVFGQVGVSFLKGTTGGSGVFWCFWFKYIRLSWLFSSMLLQNHQLLHYIGVTTTFSGEYVVYFSSCLSQIKCTQCFIVHYSAFSLFKLHYFFLEILSHSSSECEPDQGSQKINFWSLQGVHRG